jgi:hypothetical protein
MPFLPLKFLAGFNIFDGEKLGKLVFYAILICVAIGIYHKTFVMPTYKTVQQTHITQPGTVTIYQDGKKPDDHFIGAKVWKLKLGVSW